MPVHELAGQPIPDERLPNIPRLVAAYYSLKPDFAVLDQRIAFGTSGHRGSSEACTFNEDHILAIAQAVCDERKRQGIDGPLFVGMDTHALSEPAFINVVEVLAANSVVMMLEQDLSYTPTPAVSHAILVYNKGRKKGLADGLIITPSHNPPTDGGIKYNPPSGGPAGTDITARIEARANELLERELKEVRRMPYRRALVADTTHRHDYIQPYVQDLDSILDMESIAASSLKIGVDPMGGAGLHYWDPIASLYKLDISVVNRRVDPRFGFMTLDKDGKIRMDCSSPYAMASLISLKDRFDIAFGNDPDYDRHGIVTPTGLMNPNHYLSVAIWYLFQHRSSWSLEAAVGKTLVSSSMIDRVAASLGRDLQEVPVGFKWFVPGLLDGSYGFGGEESAGASFLRKNGEVWTTDKDGIILDLLAAEIMAKTSKDPADHYQDLVHQFGQPFYSRMEAPANREQKTRLKNLAPDMLTSKELAGEAIVATLTRAPGNQAPIGGLKVASKNAWFAARPSGTEDIYKIYAESFKGPEHLMQVQEEAQAMVEAAFKQTVP